MSEIENIECVNGTYIFFVKASKQNPKTSVWNIFSKEGNSFLGEIRWYGRWRKYSLIIDCRYIKDKLVFESKCLTEITNFLDDLMKKRKDKK